MDWRSRITIEPGKSGGRPSLRGLRITVGDVLACLANGMSEDEILHDFPDLEREDIRASPCPGRPTLISTGTSRSRAPRA